MQKVTETSTEQLQPEIDQMIAGAKQAVQYFKWMLDANAATNSLIKSQLEYANEQLEKLELEKNLKHKPYLNPELDARNQSSDQLP